MDCGFFTIKEEFSKFKKNRKEERTFESINFDFEMIIISLFKANARIWTLAFLSSTQNLILRSFVFKLAIRHWHILNKSLFVSFSATVY